MTRATPAVPIRLSIAIPTYNFGAYIGAAIDSFLPLPSGVELVVVDGASTDDTADVVAARTARDPGVRYERLAQKGGIDHDMAKAVELSGGEFCWLFSADDVAHPGALTALLARLDPEVDVFLFAHSNCTLDMEVLHEKHRVLAGGDRRVDIADPEARIAYFRDALSTEAFFSYMSGLCVRRAAWMAAQADPQFDGECWAHAARLLSLTKSRLVVDYLAAPCIDRRGDNDSFFHGSVTKRYGIAVDGYQHIGRVLFGDGSEEAFHIRRVLRSELGIHLFVFAKELSHRNPSVENRKMLNRLVADLYRWESRMERLIYEALPAWSIRWVRLLLRTRRRIYRMFGAPMPRL